MQKSVKIPSRCFLSASLLCLVLPFLGGCSQSEQSMEVRLFRQAERKAKQGDADAQYTLGVNYLNGHRVPKDEGAGREWLRKAAEQGHAEAAYRLGLCYFYGRDGVSKNKEEASKWFQKSGLGEEEEFIVRLPKYRSEEWLSEKIQQAEQGDAEAMYTLSLHYMERKSRTGMPAGGMPGAGMDDLFGPPLDEDAGLKWLRNAAELGHAEAQFSLGNHYARYVYFYRLDDSRNREEDAAETEKWLRKAAEQGYALAQYALGSFYFRARLDKIRDEGRLLSFQEANISEEEKEEGIKYLRMAKASGKRLVMRDADRLLQEVGGY